LILFTSIIIAACFSCSKDEEEDYTYSIEKVWWSDSIDTNFDGYAQSKRLNFNVHVQEEVSRRINARVFYKLHEASSFTFYAFMGERDVLGGGADNNFFVPIGSINKELPRGFYDFKIEIYEPKFNRIEASTGSQDSTVLTNQRFEESSNDKNYSIHTWWSDKRDRNANNYWRFARLNINVDIDAALQKNVYAKIYYKNSVESEYRIYYEFPVFSIYWRNIQDTVSYVIGSPTIELESGAYDFRIELYESGSNILVALSDESSPELNDVKFESEKDDEYYYTISNVSWTDPIDLDNDSYTQFRKLNFKVDVDKNDERTIFAKIFYKLPDSTEYNNYDSTANFKIKGSIQSNVYTVNIGTSAVQLDSARYDFLISIYEPTEDTVEAFQTSVSASTNTILAKQKFETRLTDIKK
jgi:hypothetical protein